MLFPNYSDAASFCVLIYTSSLVEYRNRSFPPSFPYSVHSFFGSFYLNTEEACIGMGHEKTGKCLTILLHNGFPLLVGYSAEVPLPLGASPLGFGEVYSFSPYTWACREFVDLSNDTTIHAILSWTPITFNSSRLYPFLAQILVDT